MEYSEAHIRPNPVPNEPVCQNSGWARGRSPFTRVSMLWATK